MTKPFVLLPLMLMALLLLGFSFDAGAAQGDRDLDPVLDIMPDMADRFAAVDEFVAEKKWERALEKLAEIEEEAGDSVWTMDGKVYVSVREYIRQRLMLLPEDGLAFYRLRCESEARALYEDGLARQNVSLLGEVAARYPASASAVEALDAAASILMDRGDYAAAAGYLGQLLSRPSQAGASAAETRLKAMALAKLGFCMAKLGNRAGTKFAVEELKRLGLKEKLVVGGADDIFAFLRVQSERDPVRPVSVPSPAWPGPGGHPSHNRPMLDVRPNMSKRWELKIGDDTSPSKTPTPQPGELYSNPYGNVSLTNQTSPLPVTDDQGVVYVNTGNGVHAVDHITGRVRWSAGPPKPPEPKAQPGQPGMVFGRQIGDPLLAQQWTSWQGATSATVAGGRVFAVEAMRSTPSPPNVYKPYGTYFALSALDASSGKRLWSIHQTADPEGFEEQVCFPWAPKYVAKPDGAVLLGMGLNRDQVHLCSIDPSSGKINWKVFLAADPTRAGQIDGRRQFFVPRLGEPVVAADGVAYAATGMGVVAAVEIDTGQLRWLSMYPRDRQSGGPIDVKRHQERPGIPAHVVLTLDGGWQGGFPVVAGGRLYVASWDSNELLAFDCQSGAIVSRFPRGEFTHFAGIHNGDIILVGPKETVGVDPYSGTLRWLVPMPPGFALEGLPVLTESSVLLPAKGRLYEIRLEGQVTRITRPVAGANTSLPLGNIVSCEGRLISANKAYLTGYFSFEETYAYLSDEIKKRPDVAKPMLDRADLCHLHGRYADALRDMEMAEAALAATPKADQSMLARLNRMMFEARLKLSEVETTRAVEHINAAQRYIFDQTARVRFHLAKGAALAVAKRYEDAVEEYLTVARDMGELQLDQDESSARVGALAQEQIRKLVEQHGEQVYARVDAQLRPKFEQLVREKNEAGLREMQLLHPYSSLADNCLLEQARIVETQEFGALRAQSLLRGLTLRYPRSDVLGEAFERLLSNCLRSGQHRVTASVLKEIEAKYASVMIPWEGEQVKGADLVARLTKIEGVKAALSSLSRTLPVLVPPLRRDWHAGTDTEVLATIVSDESCVDQRGIGLAVKQVNAPPPLQYYGRIGGLRAFDIATGRTIWTATCTADWSVGGVEIGGQSQWSRNRQYAPVVCSGGVVALGHPGGIIAFDLGSGRQLWEKKWERPQTVNVNMWFNPQQLRTDYRLMNVVNQRPVFTADAERIFCHIPDGTLLCLDAATGRDAWQVKRNGFAVGPIGLFGQMVVVAGLNPNKLSAYSVLDGRLVYEKPLPGAFPGWPVYDTARSRIFLNDGMTLYCHDVSNFEQLWKMTTEGDNINMGTPWSGSTPWSVTLLDSGDLGVMRHRRSGNQIGFGVTMLDGKSGRRKWEYGTAGHRQDGNSFTNENIVYEPVFSRRFVFVPVQTYSSKRVGNQQTTEMQMSLHIVDMETGKKLRECEIQPKQTMGANYINRQPVATAAASEYAVLIIREYTREKQGTLVQVICGETGTAVLSETLPASTHPMTLNALEQRINPVITTLDGRLLVPTGKGMNCYAPGGTAKETPK